MELPKQIYNYSTGNYDLGLLLDYNKANRIDTNLDCQRGYVWTPNQKQQLIDTLMNRERIPEFHAIKEQDENIFHFADGKQRITTILLFLNNQLAWERRTADKKFEPLFNGKNSILFKDLPSNFQNMITGTQVPIAVYSGMTPKSIIKLFRKLNSGTALEGFEKSLAENIAIKRYFLEGLSSHPVIPKIFSESRIESGNADQALVRLMILMSKIDKGEEIACNLRPTDLSDYYLQVDEDTTDEELGQWVKELNKYKDKIKKYLDWLNALDDAVTLKISADFVFIFSIMFAYKDNLSEDTLKALWEILRVTKASDIVGSGADYSKNKITKYINYIQPIISGI